MNPKERVATDPVFATLVHTFYGAFEQYCGTGAGLTPSEVREASGFAWQMYAERNVLVPMMQLGLHERKDPT